MKTASKLRIAMPDQTAIATSQRRNLILDAVRRLSKTRSWVTQRDLLADLRGQGFDVQKHHVLRDLRALIARVRQLNA